MFKTRFKKFGGKSIPDVIEYTRQYVMDHPGVTISVGCDSIQRRKKTVYACTIMFYNSDVKNGAHVLFYRENIDKVRDNQLRLQKEAEYALKLAEFMHDALTEIGYVRNDITDFERKKYKFILDQAIGLHTHVKPHDVDTFIKNMTLTDYEKTVEYRLVDIHVDFNPFEETQNARGMTKNKSSVAYHAFVPWLKGLGFRTYGKPNAAASTSAADLLCKD